ncbi:CDP-alcohol phosphatidyltransferase family protein [Propionibacteriaceae bacterium Y1700]|uniref:CDP-alcohol phosphatidyltransferase family protein n=1 Tax=Microlunatus sp. Y1700 TaxID=3418487 RepID=UPI003DA766AF
MIGLGTLELTVALGFWGWVAGVAHLVVLTTLLMHGAHRAQLPGLGMANAVTLVRALLGGQVLALTIALLVGDSEALAVMIGIAVVAIALDGVDGQVARRTHNYAQGLLAVSLTAPCWSFGRDVLWLWQRRDAPRQAEMDS